MIQSDYFISLVNGCIYSLTFIVAEADVRQERVLKDKNHIIALKVSILLVTISCLSLFLYIYIYNYHIIDVIYLSLVLNVVRIKRFMI